MTQRLQRSVQDLVDVRRLRHGGFPLEMARVSLEQVDMGTVEETRVFVPPGQVITLESADTPLFVNGNAMRLGQVFTNLLTNAIVYAPDSPRIAVRPRRVRNEAGVQVQDEGAGIAAEALPRIFSRFYQVERTQGRSSQRGLGLGLYIVHELVAAHGGSIAAASNVAPNAGHGTTFTIRLPLAPNGASDGRKADQPAETKASHRPKECRRARWADGSPAAT